MNLTPALRKKWQQIIEHTDMPQVVDLQGKPDAHRRDVTIQILENQYRDLKEQKAQLLSENSNTIGGGNIGAWDPIMISMVRRAMPNLVAYDICGVQPMTGPTGLIFAMRSKYGPQASSTNYNQTNEAFMTEADTDFAGQKPGAPTSGQNGTAHAGSNPFANGYATGRGMTTLQGEVLGETNQPTFNEMSIFIDKVTVTAKTRALKAEYTVELAQDLKALHGMDAETELANILSTEILAEINREVIRTLYFIARVGAQKGTTNAGVFDLDTDSNGRWLAEKFKGLMFQVERDANQISRDTRRGKGNFIVCSSDVASALHMAGVLNYAPALQTNLTVDDTGNTFAGVINGRYKVFVDPYFDNTGDLNTELLMVGYKGSNAYDAGFFYCPYIPLQMVRAVGENTLQPKIAFRTRYGLVSNPYYTNASGDITSASNPYYRLVKVINLT